MSSDIPKGTLKRLLSNTMRREAFDLIRNNLGLANFFAFGIGSSTNRYIIEGIAHVGSAALDNEECWLLQGIMRALGLVYIEHQARI